MVETKSGIKVESDWEHLCRWVENLLKVKKD